MGKSYSHLSYGERLSIMDGLRDGMSVRAIARTLMRDPATVSREVKRAGCYPAPRYDACNAYFGAVRRRSESRVGRRKLRVGIDRKSVV